VRRSRSSTSCSRWRAASSRASTAPSRDSPRHPKLAACRHLILLAALFVLLVPAKADAAGGSYRFSGGSESARATMRNALEGSAFDWSLVPEPVTIEIVNRGCAGARSGVIVLDERLLESRPYGRAYTWGVVQHEYAHQLWWLALDDAQRSSLRESSEL
jgi:hypothetical protein